MGEFLLDATINPSSLLAFAFMKTPQRKATRKSSEMLRIGGVNLQVGQFMDYPNFSDPKGGQVLLVSFNSARLADANNQELFNGQIIVRVNTRLNDASLAMVTRLLDPFRGYFVMIVTGSYALTGSYAEVVADAVPWTNIQPASKPSKRKLRIVPQGI